MTTYQEDESSESVVSDEDDLTSDIIPGKPEKIPQKFTEGIKPRVVVKGIYRKNLRTYWHSRGVTRQKFPTIPVQIKGSDLPHKLTL